MVTLRSFEACNLILLPSHVFVGYPFSQYLKDDIQKLICGILVYLTSFRIC